MKNIPWFQPDKFPKVLKCQCLPPYDIVIHSSQKIIVGWLTGEKVYPNDRKSKSPQRVSGSLSSTSVSTH